MALFEDITFSTSCRALFRGLDVVPTVPSFADYVKEPLTKLLLGNRNISVSSRRTLFIFNR